MTVNLFLALTEDCNLDCEYCNVSKSKNNMNFKDGIKSISYFLNFFKNSKNYNIFFIWWEPLIVFSVLKILIVFIKKIEKIIKKSIQLHLVTNGLLLTEEKLQFFQKFWVQISLSFDSVDTNYNYRNFKNLPLSSVKFILANINLFLKYTDIIRIKIVVMPDEVKNMYTNYNKILIMWFKYINIQPAHWVFWSAQNIDMYLKQFEKIKKNIFSKNDINSTTFKYTWTIDKNKQIGCAKGKYEIFIDAYWYVYVCDAFLAFEHTLRTQYAHDHIHTNILNIDKFTKYSNWKYCHNDIISDKIDLVHCNSCNETKSCSKLCNAIPINWSDFDSNILKSNFDLYRKIDCYS